MFLSFISTWNLYLIAIFVAVGIALFFQLVVSKIFPIFVKNIKSMQTVNLISNPINALYSLLLALVIITLWQQFFRVQELVSKEASAITLAAHVSRAYPEAKKNKQLTKAISSYLRFLPNNKWPRISDESRKLEIQSAYNLLNSLEHIKPSTQRDQALLIRLEEKITKSIEAKQERLSLNNKLPAPILTILFVGGITLLFFLCIISKERNRVYFTLGNIAVAALIGFYLALIIDLDTPYSGTIGYLNLNSSPYVDEVIKLLKP